MRLLLSICLLLSLIGRGNAATFPAASIAQSDVQAAVDLCSANGGDTVTVPAGTATYNSEVDILNKGIKLIGAGIGQSIIKRGSSLGAGNSPIFVRGYPSNVTWITGFTFQQDLGSTYGAVQVESRVHSDPRPYCFVSSNKFEITGGSGTRRHINFLGCDGLIWSCGFTSTNAAQSAAPEADIDGDQWGTNNFYKVAAANPFGTTNQLIVEDCWFYFDGISEGTDVYAGRSMTVRYCSITNMPLGDHGGDSALWSSFVKEWYHNDSYTTVGGITWAGQFRGGTGVIWSNDVHWGGQWILKLYRAGSGFTAPGASYDGNFHITYPGQGFPTGYPLLGQHGWHQIPGTVQLPPCSGGCTYTNYQTNAFPIHIWGNMMNGSFGNPKLDIMDADGIPNVATNYVKENREYYTNGAPAWYTPWTYPDPRRVQFDGSGGGGGGGSADPNAFRKFGHFLGGKRR